MGNIFLRKRGDGYPKSLFYFLSVKGLSVVVIVHYES